MVLECLFVACSVRLRNAVSYVLRGVFVREIRRCVRRGTSGLEESREADFALDVHCLLVDLQLGLGLLASILEVALPLLRRLGSL